MFGPFEGQRIAEVQSTNEFVDGVLQGFSWVSTKDNPTDWCTKPRELKDAAQGGFCEPGVGFLLTEESSWPIKLTFKRDNFEGEEIRVKRVNCLHAQAGHPNFLPTLVNHSSSWTRMLRVLACLFRAVFPFENDVSVA